MSFTDKFANTVKSGARSKVVLVAPWFGVNSGGAEIALRLIGRYLKKSGFDVEVYTTASMNPYGDWFANNKYSVSNDDPDFQISRFPVNETGYQRYLKRLQFNQQPNATQKEEFFKYGLTSKSLIDKLVKLDQDTMIIGGPYYQALLHQCVSALPSRIHLMPAFHDEAPFYYPKTGELIKNSKGLIFLSEGEKKMTVLTHGMMMSKAKIESPVVGLPYINSVIAEEKQNDLAIRLITPYMLYVGRVDRGKNVDQLVDWHMATNETRILESKEPIKLILAGVKGYDVAENQWIKSVGFITDEEKRALIKNAVALVNLSKNESFSFVMFEAWQVGTPVIAHSHCQVTSQHIESSAGGFSCENSSEYAAAVKCLESDEHRAVLATNGNTYADEMCEEGMFGRRLIDVLKVA